METPWRSPTTLFWQLTLSFEWMNPTQIFFNEFAILFHAGSGTEITSFTFKRAASFVEVSSIVKRQMLSERFALSVSKTMPF